MSQQRRLLYEEWRADKGIRKQAESQQQETQDGVNELRVKQRTNEQGDAMESTSCKEAAIRGIEASEALKPQTNQQRQ